MIPTDNNNDTVAAFAFAFLSGIFSRLLEVHFFETVLLALFCGFLGTFAKNAGAYAWKLCANYVKEKRRIIKSKKPSSPENTEE